MLYFWYPKSQKYLKEETMLSKLYLSRRMDPCEWVVHNVIKVPKSHAWVKVLRQSIIFFKSETKVTK